MREQTRRRQEVFVPLTHPPGEAQVDFGEALVKMNGALRKVAFFVMDFPGKTDLAQEGDETGQAAKGRDRFGRFVQNELGLAEERGNFGASRFVRGGSGGLSIHPYAHNLFRNTTLFQFRKSGLK